MRVHQSIVFLAMTGAGFAAGINGVAAQSGDKEEKGKSSENHKLDAGLVAAVSIVIFTVVLLPLIVWYIVRRIRRSAKAEALHDSENSTDVSNSTNPPMETSQVPGQPTVAHAAYDPGSVQEIYAIGSAGSAGYGTAVIPPSSHGSTRGVIGTPNHENGIPTPMGFPEPRNGAGQQPMTAPVQQVRFAADQRPEHSPAYPFSGMGSPAPGPKTSFVSGGSFPRPLFAGRRLQERLRERPPSASSLVNEFEQQAQQQQPRSGR